MSAFAAIDLQDGVAIASLAVAIAVPLAGAIVAVLRRRDRSADRIHIVARNHGDGIWTARLGVTGLPGHTGYEAVLRVLGRRGRFFDDVGAAWRDQGDVGPYGARDDLTLRRLKLEGVVARTPLVRSGTGDELMAPMGLYVPSGEVCRLRIQVYAKARRRPVAQRVLAVSPAD